jgi:hypothetical protein
LLVSLAACSSAPTASTPDAGADSAPGPQPLVCPEGTRPAAEGRFCDATLSVTTAPQEIAPVRDHHTTHVVQTSAGAYLYVVGGTDAWSSIHADVQRAKLAPDGALGAFEKVADLLEARAGHCTVIEKGRITVIGGSAVTHHGQDIFGTSFSAPMDASGAIGAWEPGPTLPIGVMHQSCAVHGGWVYVTGGRSFAGSTTLSMRARIGEDGKLGAFEAQTPVEPDRSHHQSFVHGGRLYLAGGLTGDPIENPPSRDDVVAAAIAPDGTLGAWEPMGTLASGLSVSAAQEYGEAVYMLGGLEKGFSFSSRIHRLTFDEAGQITDTVLPTKLPLGRGHVHQTPVYAGHLYSVGGKDSGDVSLGRVDVISFR